MPLGTVGGGRMAEDASGNVAQKWVVHQCSMWGMVRAVPALS